MAPLGRGFRESARMPAPTGRRLAVMAPPRPSFSIMTTRADRIEALIRQHFDPVLLRVAARSRAVHALLDSEFRTGLHALALTLRTPEEQARTTGA